MLAPFLKDAPVCVSGSSHAGASAEPGHSPSSGAALGVGLESCTGREKLKEVAEQSWDPLAAVGIPWPTALVAVAALAQPLWPNRSGVLRQAAPQGLAPCPVACTECQGCVCPCAEPGEQGLPWCWGPAAARPCSSSCCTGFPCLSKCLRGALSHCSSPKVGTGGTPGAPWVWLGIPPCQQGAACPSPGMSPELSASNPSCVLSAGDVLFQMAEVHRQIQNQLEEMVSAQPSVPGSLLVQMLFPALSR